MRDDEHLEYEDGESQEGRRFANSRSNRFENKRRQPISRSRRPKAKHKGLHSRRNKHYF